MITKLPDSICDLPNVQALDLMNNQLTLLPKKIGNELLCEHNFVDDEIIDYIQTKMNNEYLNRFLKFYKDYEVFTVNDYSLEDFRMLIEDINDGLE